MSAIALIYLVGVVVGVAAVDAALPLRLALALLWPVGIAAMVVTLGMLVAVALVVFPWAGLVAAALAAALWWART